MVEVDDLRANLGVDIEENNNIDVEPAEKEEWIFLDATDTDNYDD